MFQPGVSQAFNGGNFWDCLGVGRVIGQEGVSDEVGEITNAAKLTFGGALAWLLIF